MKQAFREKNFGVSARDRIEKCNEIIERFQGEGLRLTLRQLFYQLVTRNIITNEEKSYKNLGSLLSDARLAGLVDWEAIEDRVRQPVVPTEFASLGELVDAAISSYRLPRWEGQRNYVELWVEKDALAGVLQPIARKFHVTLMVNRGYSSSSAMFESAERYKEIYHRDASRNLVLLYLGDHDPSGEDMVRDVQDRLELFGAPVEVRKIALTMDQVRKYKPPPNPAKLSDSRAEAYIAKHGAHSWEVDALDPTELRKIIVGHLSKLLDKALMDAIIAREEVDKQKLLRVAGKTGR
jgi:hypothetical protein